MQTIDIIGQTIPRLGYGTMRLPGQKVMGPPSDPAEALRVLRRTQELGIKLIDTAWYYGPDVSNRLIKEALYPYPNDLIIVTKLGGKRDEAGRWLPATSPDELRAGMERDRQLLGLDEIPITHLRWMDTELDDHFKIALDTMLEMQASGLVRNLGLSNVAQEQLDYALQLGPVVTVSNAYGVHDQQDNNMVNRCSEAGIAYLPFFPLNMGKTDKSQPLLDWARQLNASTAQVALAWLLQRSPTIVPIPGTSSQSHLEDNMLALELTLPTEAVTELSAS